MNRKFIVIAHARSGSTFVCQKIADLAQASVYFELFHNDIEQIRRFVEPDDEAVWAHFQPLSGGDLRGYFTRNPRALLDFLQARRNGRDQFFKLFPGQLKGTALNATFDGAAGVLILHRNLLHSFLSHEIALQTQQWVNADTSDKRIIFDPQKFSGYIRYIFGHYQKAEALLQERGVASADVHYEDLLIDPAAFEHSLASALQKIGAEPRAETPDTPKLRRQDARPMAADKVRNPDEMLHFLSEIGLENANDGTQRFKISEFSAAVGT
jgi:LPS sulfotransferase NodH